MMSMSETIKHHISDEILMRYSAGTLPEAFSLLVAAHVSLCDTCRAQVEACDAVGGAVLERDAGTEMSAESLEATLARIESGSIVVPQELRARCGVLPSPLQDYVGGSVDDVRWRGIGMGVKQAILPTSKEATARLLYIPAGVAVPDHSHRGLEMTMVLQGAFADEEDRFARGDVEMADQDLTHTPVAEMGADCICLAVTDAPLKFSGLIPKLAQPFLRI